MVCSPLGTTKALSEVSLPISEDLPGFFTSPSPWTLSVLRCALRHDTNTKIAP